MTWVIAIALAAAAFAVAVLVFRVARSGWTTIAAALTVGLAGYALQASPDLPGAPAATRDEGEESAWSLVDERRSMIGEDERSRSGGLITADAYVRRGRYAEAASLLRGVIAENPRDGEAWLALGNALVEHTDGALTPPALYAYRRAAELDPGGVGPGHYLGFALVRQGRLGEAAGLWRQTLANAAPDAAGRDLLAQRLARLEALLAQPGMPAIPR